MRGRPSSLDSVIGFRFNDPTLPPLCELFAVGHQVIDSPTYEWDGLSRTDGPLFLVQITLSGRGMIRIGSDTHILYPGSTFLVEIPGDHRYWLPAGSEPWEFLFVLIRPTGLNEIWKDIVTRLGPLPSLPLEHRVIRLLDQLYQEARDGHIRDAFGAAAAVYAFMTELLRFSVGQPVAADWPEAIRQAVQWLEAHYTGLQSLEPLYEQSGLSKFHFIRRFSQAVGCTPNRYLTRLRIEQAIRLLRETHRSIEDIAQAVGFAGGSYFIKVFRKWVGCPPGEFREGKGQLPVGRLFFD